MAWQGEATADGMVGTDDGGLIFAQEQSNRIIKIDEKDNVTILLARSGRGSQAPFLAPAVIAPTVRMGTIPLWTSPL